VSHSIKISKSPRTESRWLNGYPGGASERNWQASRAGQPEAMHKQLSGRSGEVQRPSTGH
jgi:hypothetical protein